MSQIDEAQVPILMISGRHDRIVNVNENIKRAAQLDSVFKHEVLETGDHLSFLTGMDMNYMMTVLNELRDKGDGINDSSFMENVQARIN